MLGWIVYFFLLSERLRTLFGKTGLWNIFIDMCSKTSGTTSSTCVSRLYSRLLHLKDVSRLDHEPLHLHMIMYQNNQDSIYMCIKTIKTSASVCVSRLDSRHHPSLLYLPEGVPKLLKKVQQDLCKVYPPHKRPSRLHSGPH